MSSIKIPLPSGKEIVLSHPEDLAASAVSALIPQVAKTATEVIARSGANIITAVVEVYEETYAKIVFYQEHGRVLREEVIPVLAKAQAYQDGRQVLKNSGLDDDIRREAEEELNRRRRGQ